MEPIGQVRSRLLGNASEPVLATTVTEGTAPLEPDPLPPLEAAPRIDSPETSETDSQGGSAASAAEAAAAGPAIEDPVHAQSAPNDGNPFGGALTPEALVQLCDVAMFVTVRAACAAKRVPWDDQTQRLAKLSKAERADLAAMAPLAIPYLSKQFAQAPDWAGAAMFGLVFASTASAHVSAATARRAESDGSD